MSATLRVLILIGILVAGLWPFHSPKNEVSWLQNDNGVLFGEHGSLVSAHAFEASGVPAKTVSSVEIWLEPSQSDVSGTILGFYQAANCVTTFALRQWLGDLVVELANPSASRHAGVTKLYVEHVFSRPKPVFVAISSGEKGTKVYVDGTLVKAFTNYRLWSQNLTGQLVVGNAPATTDTWPGQLKGIAIYNRELSLGDVERHYTSWMKGKPENVEKERDAVARYVFDEGHGSVVHSQLSSAPDLLIPEHFFVVHKQFLQWPRDEYYVGWGYWKDVGINVAGFVPLGVVFCSYFVSRRKSKSPAISAIAFGFVVSCTIEVLQGFLPTRDSGMTDIITNTLGTATGVLLYKYTAVQTMMSKLEIHA